jgi:transcriptional regulator
MRALGRVGGGMAGRPCERVAVKGSWPAFMLNPRSVSPITRLRGCLRAQRVLPIDMEGAGMYTPPAFREDDPATLRQIMREARLSTLVTATAEGLIGTPLPLIFDAEEGRHGVLYGHVAKANNQWKLEPIGEALVIFSGPDAYVTPSWYASKREHGKVVPTWNYSAVHAYGPVEFFHDEARLHAIVTRLTHLYEAPRAEAWAVTDAPAQFIAAQLRGIVGVRLPITRIEGKRKMSQNRPAADRAGVASGLSQSERESDREVSSMIPVGP